MPEPIGGISAIQKRVIYPEIARKAGIQGKVFVQAFIDEKGDVIKTKILKGIGSGCDEAALNAVKETKFTPAKQKGKLVKVQVVVPVLFKLNNSKTKNGQ
jgi:protein TonB